MVVELIVDAFLAAIILAFVIFIVLCVGLGLCANRRSPENEAWTRPELLDPGPRPSHLLPPPNNGDR